ncbi:MAG: methyl-accepting chemotaxis protein [Desulfobulbaceae bacterium]|nr:methyl-accepting chemotaxis protein [Desulfobulbaceae bacterium]
MATRYKRRTYYLKNSAQSKFILRFVALSILGGGIALSTFNFLAYKKIDALLYSMRLPSISPGGLLWNEMIYTNLFVIVFILVAFALTAKGLFNKIHGPLKKMTFDIGRINGGDLSTIVSLRQHDEFRDIASELAQMTDALRQRLAKIKALTDDIVTNTENTSAGTMDEACRANLEKTIATLRKEIEAFTL